MFWFYWPRGRAGIRTAFSTGNQLMDSAQQCLDQAAECRGLAQLAQSEAEAYALKNLARSWSGIAGQIDRYNALMRGQRFSAESSRVKGLRRGLMETGDD